MSLLRKITCFFLFMLNIHSLAYGSSEGWVGGGGELSTDENNPWFFENTKQVYFCLEIDEANFGLPPAEALAKIYKAWDYWRGQFEAAYIPTIGDIKIKIATQTLEQVSCTSPLVDIRFQFGVLSKEQIDFVKTPKHLVGVTVRTAYDQAHLKAKGFVYISPEHGPLSLDPITADGPITPKRWSIKDGILLDLVLAHELGHVFGLNHDDFDSIMGRDMPRLVVTIFDLQTIDDFLLTSVPGFFMADNADSRIYTENDISAYVHETFSIPSEVTSITLRKSNPDEHWYVFDFIGVAKEDQSKVVVGRFINDPNHNRWWSETYPLLNIYLTNQQTAFPALNIPAIGKVCPLYFPIKRTTSLIYQPHCEGCLPKAVAVTEDRYTAEIATTSMKGALDLYAVSLPSAQNLGAAIRTAQKRHKIKRK